VYVENLQPALDVAIRIATQAGKSVCIVLLEESTSLAAWKIQLAGKTHLALTTAVPLAEDEALRCCLEGADRASIALFPPPAPIKVNGAPDAGRMDGIFRRYDLPSLSAKPLEAVARRIRPASTAQPVLIGPQGVAEAPGESEFANAAVWKIILPPDLSASNDWLLRFYYVGDVARVYVNDRLITDNFYNGVCFDCGFSPDETNLQDAEVLLKVMPLRKDAPICLLPGDWPKDASDEGTAELTRVEIVQQTQHLVTLG
jgi:hypothetical protein